MIVIWLLYEEEDLEQKSSSPVYYSVMDLIVVLVEQYSKKLRESY